MLMAFVDEADFEVKVPLKQGLLGILEEFLRKNGIETVRGFGPGGIYKVDIVERIGQELAPIPDERVRENLRELISKASTLLEVGASG